MRDRLIDLRTHPDAVADADWELGLLESRLGYTSLPTQRPAWRRRALRAYERAIVEAPLSAKYALSAANQALAVDDLSGALRWYRQTADQDPGSADAVAGQGLVALRRGERAQAAVLLARSREMDARAPMVAALERALR